MDTMEIPKRSVYLETTMFNYFFDLDRIGHSATVQLFEAIRNSKFNGFTSDYTIRELLKTPDEVKRDQMLSLINDFNIQILRRNRTISKLARSYILAEIIPIKFQYDALHIACATFNNMDYLATYNFKHMIKTKDKTSQLNSREGYSNIIICTPSEVFDHDKID